MMPNVQVPLWVLVTTPVMAVLGTMFAVMLAHVCQNRTVGRMGEALRAEIAAVQTALRAEMKHGLPSCVRSSTRSSPNSPNALTG